MPIFEGTRQAPNRRGRARKVAAGGAGVVALASLAACANGAASLSALTPDGPTQLKVNCVSDGTRQALDNARFDTSITPGDVFSITDEKTPSKFDTTSTAGVTLYLAYQGGDPTKATSETLQVTTDSNGNGASLMRNGKVLEPGNSAAFTVAHGLEIGQVMGSDITLYSGATPRGVISPLAKNFTSSGITAVCGSYLAPDPNAGAGVNVPNPSGAATGMPTGQ